VEKWLSQTGHDNIIWRMRIVCWINKARDTHAQNNGYANAPHCYFYNTMHALLTLNIITLIKFRQHFKYDINIDFKSIRLPCNISGFRHRVDLTFDVLGR